MSAKPLPYSHKGDLTTGPVQGHLVRMSMPMVWSILAVIGVQLTNTYFISRLGTLELAAISFTFPVTMVISHLVFGLNIALSSVIARLIGEKRFDDVRRVTLHGTLFGVTVAFIVALITYAALEPLFRMLGADETLMPMIRDYMPLWLLASVILAVPVNGNSAMRAAGDTVTPATIMISMALLNFILDPILIYGWFGVPALGIRGAAISTAIAYTYALVFGLYAIIYKKRMISTDSLHLDLLRDSLRRLIFIAIPAGIANIIQPATAAVITALLAIQGHEAVAAYGVATRVEALAMLVVIALALGMAPIVGQNWGAGIYNRVHEAINIAIRFNFIWSFFIAVLFGLFAGHIAAAFSDDPVVIHQATLFFWIVPFSYGFGNLVFGWSSAFNAMGLPQRAFFMILVKSAITIPAAWAGGHFYGAAGIFWAIALTNLVTGLGSHVLSNRAMRGMEPAPATA
ncbi:MAG: MATE family efflux transporter [Alphaproteobacteria bacterium PRO2]|nr:MATE family efflux transporter [Alphaproteobacteria bacterium PRO2]